MTDDRERIRAILSRSHDESGCGFLQPGPYFSHRSFPVRISVLLGELAYGTPPELCSRVAGRWAQRWCDAEGVISDPTNAIEDLITSVNILRHRDRLKLLVGLLGQCDFILRELADTISQARELGLNPDDDVELLGALRLHWAGRQLRDELLETEVELIFGEAVNA